MGGNPALHILFTNELGPSVASLRLKLKQQLLILAMTSWFIGVKASVISGALLYSKGISYLFPIGKRRVLFAKRSYI